MPVAEIAACPAPSLVSVSDNLSEARHLLEAAWMAAVDISQPNESEAMRVLLNLVSQLVEGARDDVDAYRVAKAVTA
ncbi:MAG: hypothetical protein P0Y66_06190 [Candidatus Kaistia colombiensis]|nr:MAG: hypothetical protein P0Y66_06190 [Kaistia sp.]